MKELRQGIVEATARSKSQAEVRFVVRLSYREITKQSKQLCITSYTLLFEYFKSFWLSRVSFLVCVATKRDLDSDNFTQTRKKNLQDKRAAAKHADIRALQHGYDFINRKGAEKWGVLRGEEKEISR